MKKTGKKLFSLFLAVLMLLSCFSAAAAAQDDWETTTQAPAQEEIIAMELEREYEFSDSFGARFTPEKSGLYELYVLNGYAYIFSCPENTTKGYESGTLTKDGAQLDFEKNLIELESGKTYMLGFYSYDKEFDISAKISFVCDHSGKETKAETSDTCGIGYTAGVYCPDCKIWLVGHRPILKSHTDKDGDRICDVCKKEAVDASGYTGDMKNASYKLYSDGELVISGTGVIEMFDVYADESETLPLREKIEKITVNEGITQLSYKAFSRFYNLESVSLPESLEVIEEGAFETLYLKELYIPSNVTTVEEPNSINHCYFERFEVSPENKAFSSKDGILFSKDKKILYAYPGAKAEKSYTVENGVEKIGDYAFYKCYDLETLNFPESLRFVGFGAFPESMIESDGVVDYVGNIAVYLNDDEADVIEVREGTKIIAGGAFRYSEAEYVNLPKGLVSISSNAFRYNILNNLIIPETVKYVEAKAFENCRVSSLVVPKSVEFFGDCCFRDMEAIAFLNPDCEIGEIFNINFFTDEYYAPMKLIAGYSGSTAEKVAMESGAMFASLDEGHEHIYFCTEYAIKSCTEDGKAVFSCPCGKSETKTETFEKGHFWSEDSIDADGTIHYICDFCGEEKEEKCGCICHKDGIGRIFYRFVRIFWKLFKINRICDCSIDHY